MKPTNKRQQNTVIWAATYISEIERLEDSRQKGRMEVVRSGDVELNAVCQPGRPLLEGALHYRR